VGSIHCAGKEGGDAGPWAGSPYISLTPSGIAPLVAWSASHCELSYFGFGLESGGSGIHFWYSFRLACMVDGAASRSRSAFGLLMVYRSSLNSTR
jgi:hypothetical protein